MTELFLKGMKRRRKEIMSVFFVTLLTTFFMSGILMTRNILESYIQERNRDNYGDWVISETSGELSHPYLSEKGEIRTTVKPCTDADGIMNGIYAGWVSEVL